MAYHTYNTEVLVCGSKNHNTSDRAYLLFAREIGMIWATARSVREERSKQRYALQEFSHAHVSLVRGKGGWKIGSVVPIANYYGTSTDRTERTLLRNVFRLLRRVLQGEEPHTAVFDDTIDFLQCRGVDPVVCEVAYTLRTLASLGYVAHSAAVDQVVQAGTADEAIRLVSDAYTAEFQKHIEQALMGSQL